MNIQTKCQLSKVLSTTGTGHMKREAYFSIGESSEVNMMEL